MEFRTSRSTTTVAASCHSSVFVVRATLSLLTISAFVRQTYLSRRCLPPTADPLVLRKQSCRNQHKGLLRRRLKTVWTERLSTSNRKACYVKHWRQFGPKRLVTSKPKGVLRRKLKTVWTKMLVTSKIEDSLNGKDCYVKRWRQFELKGLLPRGLKTAWTKVLITSNIEDSLDQKAYYVETERLVTSKIEDNFNRKAYYVETERLVTSKI